MDIIQAISQPSGLLPKSKRGTVFKNKINLLEKLEEESLNTDTGLVDLSSSLSQQLLVQLLVSGNPKAYIELFELTQESKTKEVDVSELENVKPHVDVWKEILGDKKRMELMKDLLEVIEVTSKVGPLDKLFHAQFQMGNIFDDVDDLEKSTFYYSSSLTIAQKIGDLKYEAQVKLSLGKVYKRLKEHIQAIQCFEDYISIATNMNDIQAIIAVSQDLLEVYTTCAEEADKENQLQTSIEYYDKCVEVANIAGYEKVSAEAKHKLGLLHYRLQHLLIALEYQTTYLSYCDAVDDNVGRTKGHVAAAQVLSALGDADREIHHLESLLEVSKLLDKRTEAKAYCKLGIAYTEQGQLDYATTYFERYYNLAWELRDTEMLAWAAINIGLTRCPST